ncbi:hypothetical protein R3P38DRAFT_2956060 [Favolaschia claudopus]|uniref:Secreted protein n=1 Tax=Favolaschia claudopus TaxID=2862362 RepID=A0AAW0BEP0_9AGAR
MWWRRRRRKLIYGLFALCQTLRPTATFHVYYRLPCKLTVVFFQSDVISCQRRYHPGYIHLKFLVYWRYLDMHPRESVRYLLILSATSTRLDQASGAEWSPCLRSSLLFLSPPKLCDRFPP